MREGVPSRNVFGGHAILQVKVFVVEYIPEDLLHVHAQLLHGNVLHRGTHLIP